MNNLLRNVLPVLLENAFLQDESDTNDDEDLPPLVRKEPVTEASANNVPPPPEAVLEAKPRVSPLYPVCHMDFDVNHDDVPPPLISKTTGKVVVSETKNEKCKHVSEDSDSESEKEDIVYKKLKTQGEVVEIPEKLVKEMPYIDTLLSGRFTISEEDGIVTSDEIDPKLLKILIRYLNQNKLYTLLACLPADCDAFQLFELLSFLAIKPPISITKESIKERLMETPEASVSSQGELVKFALAIFYAYNLFDYRKEKKLRNKIYDTFMYIFKSDDSSFKPRAKHHLLELVKKCVLFTIKQFYNIKKLKVSDTLDKSDEESVGSLEDDDWFDDCCDYMCYDSDDDMAYMFGHHFGLEDVYDNFYYCDSDDFYDSDDDIF